MAFPGHDASRFLREWLKAHSGCTREAAFKGEVPARIVDKIKVLVKPDRHRGADARDQGRRDSALGLGERSGARIVEAAEWLPAPGKVAVEINAVGVAACLCSGTVRIEVRNDPEQCFGCRLGAGKTFRDRDTSTFVAVNAADDQRSPGIVEVAGLDRRDRASVDRAPEQKRSLTGGIWGRPRIDIAAGKGTGHGGECADGEKELSRRHCFPRASPTGSRLVCTARKLQSGRG